MFGLGKRNKSNDVELPAILQPENPVNYDSVLDYLVGLDGKEYEKLLKVAVIYRDANKSAAKVLGVKDQPTTQLLEPKLSEEEIEEGLTQYLETPIDDLKDAILNEPDKAEVKKTQSPSSSKKISVNEKH